MADDPKKTADEAAAAAKAKAEADAAAAAKKDGQTDGDGEGGELARVFSKDGDKTETAPKATDLKVTVPEDLKHLIGATDDYVTVAREAGLTQAQLDKVMATQLDRVKSAAQEADQEAERLALDWERDLRADPKLGGANFKASIDTAETGARALGGAALAVKLAKHLKGEERIDGPSLVRAFHMVGLRQAEDKLGLQGGSGAADPLAGKSRDERRLAKRYGGSEGNKTART